MDEVDSKYSRETIAPTAASPTWGNSSPRSTRNTYLKSIVTAAAIIYLIFSFRGRFSDKRGSIVPGISNGALKQPNIVFIMTDDQDVRLGSLDYMDTVQKRIIGEGINVVNHFGTVALCCPGRATLFRGQAAHNTNITHVNLPGGGYIKWRRTGEWKNYLPHWLRQAGYTTAYFGKFMNGYGLNNYKWVPEGWDWTDILTGPYIYKFEHVVTSENGEHPLYYEGWHQIDVLRIKAVNQLHRMIYEKKPFYLEIAPASPHVLPGGFPTVPTARHQDLWPDLIAPRLPNYNPSDRYTQQKVQPWMRDMPPMNDSIIEISDLAYRRRIQALQGVDDLVNDIMSVLEEKGILDETYIIYTTDNGFHIGNHRLPGGKGQPYREDTNLPFAVRGPGIPAGAISTIPQTHIDIAPTLLDIAQLPHENWPPFFDGRSLLKEWQTLTPPDDNISREILNVEYWGKTTLPAGQYTRHFQQNSYKCLRIVSNKENFLFNRWCHHNRTELYNTTADPYELINLAIKPDKGTQRLMNRLSGLLLVTKSCGRETCRKPWDVLRDDYGPDARFSSLDEAMDHKYDKFFAELPHFGFRECMNLQSVDNEGPYYPPSSSDLGSQYREWIPPRPDDVVWENNYTLIGEPPWTEEFESIGTGSEEQRWMGFDDVMKSARRLTDEEIGWPVVRCGEENEWCGAEWDDD